MDHIHTFLLPAQDGINPITERIEGRCHCGETKGHNGLWDEAQPGNWRVARSKTKAVEIDEFVAGLGWDNPR